MRITRTKSEAGFLVLVVFVLGVLVGGLGNHVWGQRVWGMRNERPKHTDFLAEFTQRLDLTPMQQEQVKIIAEETSAQWRAVYAPADRKREEIRDQSRVRLRAVMTPEQLPKFEQLMSEMDAQRVQQQNH